MAEADGDVLNNILEPVKLQVTAAAATTTTAPAGGERTDRITTPPPPPMPSPLRHQFHDSDTSLSSGGPDEPKRLLLSVDTAAANEGTCGGQRSVCCSPSRSAPGSPLLQGPRFKLIREGSLHVCRLNHTRTLVSKILSSRFLRRWELHHLTLTDSCIMAKTLSGFMEEPVPYRSIQDIYPVARWDSCGKFCIRIVVPDGSLLLQVTNSYLRDQWLHSLLWKKSMMRFQKILGSCSRPEILLKELTSLVDLALSTPLQDEEILHYPLDIISDVISKCKSWMPCCVTEEFIVTISPLLERSTPTSTICDFLTSAHVTSAIQRKLSCARHFGQYQASSVTLARSHPKHCRLNPRSIVVVDICTPVVQRILKHNMDFGKHPQARAFVQEYLLAIRCHNNGENAIKDFIQSVHGPASTCPHPRVLHNLVAISVAAVHCIFEERRINNYTEAQNDASTDPFSWESRLDCFITLFIILSEYEDWRPVLAELLQPMPFHDDALACHTFTSKFKEVIARIGEDDRCNVHQMVLGVRDEKGGWFHLYCPGGAACDDEGDLWSRMLDKLLSCCCRRRRFLQSLAKSLGPCMLRALRDDETCQKTLCAMLEFDAVESPDMQLQLISTLQSTPSGKRHYAELSLKQMHLRQLQQKGGPKKLALPSRSTDADLARLLSSGSFGDLECLSLAFTQVTSACAEELIKLPSLRYLNLWCTQFGDSGLQMISEHLPKLQVLNLCETRVTDQGLSALTALKNLRKLNLNSTDLTAGTFEKIKKTLPVLQECDVRYTDAWGF